MSDPEFKRIVCEYREDHLLEWHCDPPAIGEWFIAVEDEWNDDFSKRIIRAWQPVEQA